MPHFWGSATRLSFQLGRDANVLQLFWNLLYTRTWCVKHQPNRPPPPFVSESSINFSTTFWVILAHTLTHSQAERQTDRQRDSANRIIVTDVRVIKGFSKQRSDMFISPHDIQTRLEDNFHKFDHVPAPVKIFAQLMLTCDLLAGNLWTIFSSYSKKLFAYLVVDTVY